MISCARKILHKVLLVVVFLFFFQLPSFYITAQSLRVISTQDGLPQSYVSGLEQDKQGLYG